MTRPELSDPETIRLWERIDAALEGHRTHPEGKILVTDADVQVTIDRIARKVLHADAPPSFNPTSCTVREEGLSVDDLKTLEKYRPIAENTPKRLDPVIVLLEFEGRRYILDGNRRVNKWLGEGTGCEAVVLTYSAPSGRVKEPPPGSSAG